MNIEEQIERDEFSEKLSLSLKSVCPTEGPFPENQRYKLRKKLLSKQEMAMSLPLKNMKNKEEKSTGCKDCCN